MQIAIVVPSYFPRVTGNAVSARRIVEGLAARGHEAKVLDLEALGVYIPNVIEAYEPDVVHAFHARRTGHLVRERRPLVISLTGTDVQRDLSGGEKRAQVLEACRAAQALVVHHPATAEPLLAADPSLAPKVRVVPKGVLLAAGPAWSLREHFAIPPDRRVFLLPGGLRPIKGQHRAIEALDGLDVDLVLAGPELDARYAAEIREAAATRPWVRRIDIRPTTRMAGAYRDADVVLNCSDSEGMSNALLEAMSCGRAVIASDVPGNRSIVSPGVNGLLYGSVPELREAAKRLRDDAALRATLGAAGALRVRTEHSAEKEMDALLAVYAEVVARTKR